MLARDAQEELKVLEELGADELLAALLEAREDLPEGGHDLHDDLAVHLVVVVRGQGCVKCEGGQLVDRLVEVRHCLILDEGLGDGLLAGEDADALEDPEMHVLWSALPPPLWVEQPVLYQLHEDLLILGSGLQLVDGLVGEHEFVYEGALL